MAPRLLLYAAVGDAYGAGFEFADPSVVAAENSVSCYRQHETHVEVLPGMYTDDTQMSIAVAECLLNGPFSKELLAEAFVTAFKRDERAGYAGGFHAFLRSVKDGSEFLARIKPYSNKNGAAMRSLPIGFLPDPQEVMKYASLQATLTHDTEEGRRSAQAAALLAHYCLYHGSNRDGLADFLDRHVPVADFSWHEEWTDPVPARGYATVRAAVTALKSSRSLKEVLERSVAFTGDVDTVAVLALGAASCLPDCIEDLPETLFLDLENGPYGRDFIAQLDEQLALKFGF